jgi:hypothetical protein
MIRKLLLLEWMVELGMNFGLTVEYSSLLVTYTARVLMRFDD